MILLKNANLYGEKIKDILISSDEIVKVDEKIEISGIDMEVIDLNGKVVIPALIDQHVHVTGGGGEGGMTTRCPELEVSDIVESGVGTLVGLLGTDGVTRSIENLIAKTKSLREYGFNAYCLTGSYELPSPTLTGSVKKDILFIDECIGVKVAINDHRCSHPTYEEMLKLGGEARFGGLLGNKAGVVHIHVGSGKHGISQVLDIIKNENIPASVYRPTHMNIHMEESVMLTKLGSYADFTTGEDHKKIAKIVIEALEKCEEGFVTMSSDSNGSMPKWNEKREIIGIKVGKMSTLYGTVKSMVLDYGLSLREALKPCTENVAKALKMYPRVGCIESGSRADILVLDKDYDINDFILKGKFVLKDKERLLKINFMD